MKKIKSPELYKAIKTFLTSYLPEIQKKSPNTVRSYQAAINLYLEFLQESKHMALSDVTQGCFSVAMVLEFTDWLKRSRENVPPTINLRVTHIRKFCKYLSQSGLLTFSDYVEIAEIEKEKDDRAIDFIYLSIPQTKLILKQPDKNTLCGLRDHYYIALLYDSGCRVQELLDLMQKDVVNPKADEWELHVIGKGRKYRVTPLSKEIGELHKQYIAKMTYRDASDYLFPARGRCGKEPMSQDNVARFLKKYEAMAKAKDPDIPHLHAHLFRRTRAMHLYQAGVPLPLIAEWLGHSQLETTQIYARATVEMKRKASEKLSSGDDLVFKSEQFKYASDDEILKILYGLK